MRRCTRRGTDSFTISRTCSQRQYSPAGVIVDSITGVSGAGRSLKHTSLFCTVSDDLNAYGLLDHRHTPEIEQETGAQVLFTPHLAPLSRGLLATCYARPRGAVSTDSLLATLAGRYSGEPFIVVGASSPSTKATMGSNTAHITARYDARTNTVITICAIDNLAKGASGGAVQAANVALGMLGFCWLEANPFGPAQL